MNTPISSSARADDAPDHRETLRSGNRETLGLDNHETVVSDNRETVVPHTNREVHSDADSSTMTRSLTKHERDQRDEMAESTTDHAGRPEQTDAPAVSALPNPEALSALPNPEALSALPDRADLSAREREQFGGMQFGSGFFGWLTATGMAVLLLAAAGAAFAVTTSDSVDRAVQESHDVTGTAQTVGLIGVIVVLIISFVAYFSGGYVAGRMARFSGAKQGFAVWLWALITTAVVAAVAAIAGSRYNVLSQLNLPRIPVDEGSVTTFGIIAIVAAILVALVGALLGGTAGTRFHRRVDAIRFQL